MEPLKEQGKISDTIDEHKFANLNWVKVLDEIWKYAPNKYGRGNRGYDDNHPLAKKLKIKGYELMLITSFLEEQKLIEYDQQQHNWIQITSKGFDVALQNRSVERNDRISKSSLFLSLAVTIFALTSLLNGIDDIIQKWLIGGLVIIALIVGGIVVRKI